MKLHTVETGFFKLDGGAMFGVVPKSLWNKLNPADENNMIRLAMRCLLIEDGKRLMLIDNGIGNKQDQKFFSHYYLHGDASLERSLDELGFHRNDITDMILTHLHFDHCGGSIEWNADHTKYQTTFPNATYYVNETHWNEAMAPNPREKASFLKENLLPIEESGQLKKIDEREEIHPAISFLISNGHTLNMIHPVISYKGKKVIYMADMIPTQAHIPVPYVMGYDVRPLDTMKEKSAVLADAALTGDVLFFEHDPFSEACIVTQTEKGVRKGDDIRISDL
jgi:glyoxylase-like metal-dependent hydrolase (beta-lactamase superfamily II)